MILRNLVPSGGLIEFKASYSLAQNVLNVSFFDPATWCQTHSIALKCKNALMAVRWLYKAIDAVFDSDGFTPLLDGSYALGNADGNLVVPMTMTLASEIVLTDDVYTIWFSGAYPPFDTRQFSLDLLSNKTPVLAPPKGLQAAIDKAFSQSAIPCDSQTALSLLEIEYHLKQGAEPQKASAVRALVQLFVCAGLGTELKIVEALEDLEQELLDFLRNDVGN
ncbi:hypothetical protein [Rhodoluna sp.]|uniref:hypothetical protein n=1 Tax=Rhodoluna sp. TaxID=1969481 RepID=UPI0025CE7CBE|nr:hypothetical protein [Rhodoluna sp.]